MPKALLSEKEVLSRFQSLSKIVKSDETALKMVVNFPNVIDVAGEENTQQVFGKFRCLLLIILML